MENDITNTQDEIPEDRSLQNFLKFFAGVLIFSSILVYKMGWINPIDPCDTCGTMFNIQPYEISSTIGFGTKHHFCDSCAVKKRREINEENENRKSQKRQKTNWWEN